MGSEKGLSRRRFLLTTAAAPAAAASGGGPVAVQAAQTVMVSGTAVNTDVLFKVLTGQYDYRTMYGSLLSILGDEGCLKIFDEPEGKTEQEKRHGRAYCLTNSINDLTTLYDLLGARGLGYEGFGDLVKGSIFSPEFEAALKEGWVEDLDPLGRDLDGERVVELRERICKLMGVEEGSAVSLQAIVEKVESEFKTRLRELNPNPRELAGILHHSYDEGEERLWSVAREVLPADKVDRAENFRGNIPGDAHTDLIQSRREKHGKAWHVTTPEIQPDTGWHQFTFYNIGNDVEAFKSHLRNGLHPFRQDFDDPEITHFSANRRRPGEVVMFTSCKEMADLIEPWTHAIPTMFSPDDTWVASLLDD